MDRLIGILERFRKPIVAALLALSVAAAAFNVFTGLGSERIRSWDEARHGVSACEMMTSGNYIVNTYNCEPDYWNVKPVLSFYGNLLGIKLFGKSIFGFRFFSAFSYLLIAALTFLLLYREAGIGAALVGTAAFIVCPTNWLHSFRSGDPDALDQAVFAARKAFPRLPVEVEVESLEECASALRAKPEWIMLDNMSCGDMEKCVAMCRGTRTKTEASGGITLERARKVAATGVTAISLGCLTHSAGSVDLSLEWSAT